MRLALTLALSLLLLPLLVPAAAAWPPVCLQKTVGEEGGKVYADAWLSCHVQATVGTCPKDGFCTEVSTDDLPEQRSAAETCYHTVHGHGFDTWTCVDPKGPVGCKVYSKTYRWEGGWSSSCIA